jgi:hypothetical protein
MPSEFSTPEKPDPAEKAKPKRVRVLPEERFSVNGRPGKRTPTMERKLLAAISKGAPYRIACLACGISEDTFAHWRRKDPDFQRRVDEASGRMALRLLAKIERQADENFSAAAWMLERRFVETFARPEIQLMAAQHHTTVNSLSINISAAEAQALEDRIKPVRKTVAALFDTFYQRHGGPDPGQPLPETP